MLATPLQQLLRQQRQLLLLATALRLLLQQQRWQLLRPVPLLSVLLLCGPVCPL
jgi:hypothetical protein